MPSFTHPEDWAYEIASKCGETRYALSEKGIEMIVREIIKEVRDTCALVHDESAIYAIPFAPPKPKVEVES